MRRSRLPALPAALFLLLLAGPRADADDRHRLALVVGANRGDPQRATLRYAVTDAERFADVLQRLGGVAAADCILLSDPSRRGFLRALGELRDRALRLRGEGGHVEVVFYYSGHADEGGLMLGAETLSYREVRDALQGMAADVGIAVLDACDSGAITRLKGGSPRPAFLTDESMRLQGHAFLTSSSENEAAQESEQLRGSFFTHALVSGLRGAADTSGDGKVTLGEAYQFAFQETLSQTARTEGGAQHPAYDIRMVGTGDVVMTDLRQATAALVLGPEFDGRFFVRDAKGRLVVELYKPAGRRAEIAVEPGRYDVQYEQDRKLYSQESTVADGERKALERPAFEPLSRVATQARGGAAAAGEPTFSLGGRTRIELSGLGGGISQAYGGSFTVGLSLVHWLGEGVALEGADDGSTRVGGSSAPSPAAFPHATTDDSFGLAVGGRLYFPRSGRARGFLRATVGPRALFKTEYGTNGDERSYSEGVVAGWIGAGGDWQFGRRFALTARIGWGLQTQTDADFSAGVTFGYAFGGRP